MLGDCIFVCFSNSYVWVMKLLDNDYKTRLRPHMRS